MRGNLIGIFRSPALHANVCAKVCWIAARPRLVVVQTISSPKINKQTNKQIPRPKTSVFESGELLDKHCFHLERNQQRDARITRKTRYGTQSTWTLCFKIHSRTVQHTQWPNRRRRGPQSPLKGNATGWWNIRWLRRNGRCTTVATANFRSYEMYGSILFLKIICRHVTFWCHYLFLQISRIDYYWYDWRGEGTRRRERRHLNCAGF